MITQLFSAKFLKALPSDNDEALIALANEFDKFDITAVESRTNVIQDLVEITALMRAFFIHRCIKIPVPGVSSTEGAMKTHDKLAAWFEKMRNEALARLTERMMATKLGHYSNLFSSDGIYEFSDIDHQRLQSLINELRDLITKTEVIDENHKYRLLRRLEAMQSELHKTVSDIDRFWAFVGEAGIQVRIFGENMKPICERISEIGKIVLAVVAAKEGIKPIAAPDVTNFMLLPPANGAKPPGDQTLT